MTASAALVTAAEGPATPRQLGAFYTPEPVVDRMVSMVDDLHTRSSILEPSGGDGAFVLGLSRAGVDPGTVKVWDLNPDVRTCLEELGAQVTITDSLISPPEGTFDLIIGNPPYLNKASDYVKENRNLLTPRFASIGASDTYAMFTALAISRLAPGGQLVFLISDTFLTLGLHRRLRKLMLTIRLDEIVLLPDSTFPKATVHTAIVKLTRTTPAPGHVVQVRDERNDTLYSVPQDELASGPGSVFAYKPSDRAALALTDACPPLMDYLHGGLGMFTRDNARHLSVDPAPRTGRVMRPYHKVGGDTRWFAPLDHWVSWDSPDRALYGVPATAHAGTDPAGRVRRGFILSGVSTRLAARTMVRGALWESNKCFGLFPKDPDRYPVEFFLSILNSSVYTRVARALNHTVSLQVRDLMALPMLPFTDSEVAELTQLGFTAAAWVRDGGVGTPQEQDRIDSIVEQVAARASGASLTSDVGVDSS